MPAFDRGDIVLVNYPFVTGTGAQQKVRPALVISDPATSRRFPDDVILAAITSRHVAALTLCEFRIDLAEPDFVSSGLKGTSIIRLDFLMTVPHSSINRKLGSLNPSRIPEIEMCLKRSLGIP